MSGVRNVEALVPYLAARRRMPFDWRRNNCGQYIGGAVAAQTGYNPVAGLGLNSRRAVRAAVAEHGSMEALASSRLPRIAPSMAQRGDIAAVEEAGDEFGVRLMVVEGDTLVGPGPRGERRLSRAAMVMAWAARRPENAS